MTDSPYILPYITVYAQYLYIPPEFDFDCVD